MAHVGIFGPTLCGKTTLAKHLSKEYRKLGYGSLVLLAFPDDWGAHAWTTTDPEKFQAKIWKARQCMVFVEEAASTIGRDRDKMDWFTRIRHQGHVLHVLGHNGTDLLPGQRRQITRLFLFRQPRNAAQVWADEWTNDGLLESASLRQYEFLDAKMFGVIRKTSLKL